MEDMGDLQVGRCLLTKLPPHHNADGTNAKSVDMLPFESGDGDGIKGYVGLEVGTAPSEVDVAKMQQPVYSTAQASVCNRIFAPFSLLHFSHPRSILSLFLPLPLLQLFSLHSLRVIPILSPELRLFLAHSS